ncbi:MULTISPECIES: Lrp/AsnC family transcriptional regulator [Pseudomonas]|uniref:Lrp/AsnC family transcriptional regulator n=1 Tax=Pseudomonas TaxID=286 RepID=UPI0023630AA5|nr:Lrp/AsnC family transcriptional regulator [Pseudomonas asplenii]
MNKLTRNGKRLDDIDRALVFLLYENSRTSIRALARRVGLSAPACSDRLKRLELTGVICRFSVELSALALGYVLQALVRVKPYQEKFQDVEKLLQNLAECVACYRITGDDSFVCHLYVDSVEHLDHVLRDIARVADTHTSIIKAIERKLPVL